MWRKKKDEITISSNVDIGPYDDLIQAPPYIHSWVYEPSVTSTPWSIASTTLNRDDWKIYPDLVDKLAPEYKEVKTVSSQEKTREGVAHVVVCRNREDLSTEHILKNLSVIKGKLMLDVAPIRVKYIECYMTPTVKNNIVLASKKLQMYGKKRPFIARFDEYGRRLSDEINIDTMEGMKLYIVDPKEHGEFYFALRAVEFPYNKNNKMSTEPIPMWITEDSPF